MSTAKRGRPSKFNLKTSASPSILNFVKRSEPSGRDVVNGIISDLITKVVSDGDIKTAHRGDSASDKQLSSWKNDFNWLRIEGSGVDMRLRCQICTDGKVSTVWARGGSCNIQRDTIVKHNRSAEHSEAERKFLLSKAAETTICSAEGDTDAEVGEDDIKLFRTVFYAAREELPSGKINSLLELQRLNGADIKYKNLSWDTLSEIQSCIKTIFQRDLVADIIDSGVFSIMLDESTDVTVQKHLSICVRYVKNGESVTSFFGNVHIKDGKAHTIVKEVIRYFEDLGLNPGMIVSLATDGAAVMTGRKGGVGVQLKSKVSPFMLQTHCIAHRLNLAVNDSIKKDLVLEKFRDKFSSLYYFMSSSSVRVERLKDLQAVLGEPELTVKEPHNIRWLGLKNAVKAVYESYSSILATLTSFSGESSTAKGLFKYFSDYKTVLLVSLMLDVHECLGIFSQQLQQQNLCFSQIQPLLDGTLGHLEHLESNDGEYLRAMRNCLDIKQEDSSAVAYLDGEKLLRYSDRIDSEFSSLRKLYVTRLQKNIRHRFRKEDNEMFQDLSIVLEPSVVSLSSETESLDALEKVGLLYGEDKEVKIIHGDLQEEGLNEETKVVEKLLDKEKLSKQWPCMKGMLQGSYKHYSLQNLCKRVILMHANLSEFAKLCKIALCFSVTSVECERSFSTQNRLKNKYRGSIKSENLDTLIFINMSGHELTSFNPKKAAKLWLIKKKRRKSRLFQEYKQRKKGKDC